jgi:hypothetical protein
MIRIITGDHNTGKTKYIKSSFDVNEDFFENPHETQSMFKYTSLTYRLAHYEGEQDIYINFPERSFGPKQCFSLGVYLGIIGLTKNIIIETQSESLHHGVMMACIRSDQELDCAIIEMPSDLFWRMNTYGVTVKTIFDQTTDESELIVRAAIEKRRRERDENSNNH